MRDLKGNKEPGNAAIQENIIHQGPAGGAFITFSSCWKWEINSPPSSCAIALALSEITRAIRVHKGNLLHFRGKCSRHRYGGVRVARSSLGSDV